MLKRIILAMVLVVAAMGTPALAQGPINPQHSDPTWKASYWNNMTLSGTPALTQEEANINYTWGLSSPAPGIINVDGFSARWTRYIDVTPGNYRFSATSDDGIRVWIDGVLLLDKWYDHSVQTFTFDRYLGPGHHLVQVEYYENTVDAVAQFSWVLLDAPVSGWRGEYFNNLTLSGTPTLVRQDPAINFNWGWGSPAPGVVNADNFSVRWTRTVPLAVGTYRFTLTCDDGARLWVNGHLLIDAWYDQAPTTYTGDIYLPGGNINLELQYYEKTERAVVQLSWSTGSGPTPTPTPPPGGIVVDNLDPGFMKGGDPASWRTVAEGYNHQLLWTFNNDTTRPNYNWARWYPTLTPGRYEVYVYIPFRYTTTAQARYWVVASGQFTLRIISQSANGDCWVSLGTYYFQGNGAEYVSLADVTYEPYRSRLIAFDAVKWVPRP